MGAVGLNSPRLGAFQSDIYPRGLDLGRSVIQQDVGIWKAADVADFEAGMLVAHDAAGEVVKCVSKSVLGVAKWNKTNTYKAVNVDEPISFPASGDTVNLKKPNVSNLQIRDAPDLAGTAYADPGDYTISAANGTVTHAGGGSTIPVATTVYVTYTFEMSSRDFEFQGRNFFNFLDDVTIADGRITVITDATILFTSQYDSAQEYALTGVLKNLYCGGVTAGLEGLFTSDVAEGDFVGHVIQLPSADDPFLGVRMGGDPVIVT